MVLGVAVLPDEGDRITHVCGDGGCDVLGIAVYATEGVRRIGALILDADVRQPGMGRGDASSVLGKIVGERPQTAQVAEVGTVAGGEDDRVHHLACAIGPDDLLAVQRGEHRAWVGPSPFESDSVAAGVGDERVWDELSEPVGRQVVEAGPVQPVVQISPVDPLGKEPDGTTGCHGDPGDLGELIPRARSRSPAPSPAVCRTPRSRRSSSSVSGPSRATWRTSCANSPYETVRR
jgi:hypothetical protein